MTTRRRSKRSPATAGSTKRSVIVAASVPGRGEKMNVKASSKRASAATSSVRSKSSSVSPGNPTMMSVDTARSGTIRRASASRCEVALGGVAAVHRGQHAVGAGLQRVVQLRAHGRRLGHRGERLGPHVLGVRRREADPADAVDGTDGPQQVGEQRPRPRRRVAVAAGGQLEVAAVAVDVLAEQRDLGDAGGGELADLGDDVVERPGDLHAAHRRHDAERAAVVAADLDRHPGVERRLPDGRQGRREQGVIVDHGLVEDLGDRAAAPGRRRAARRRGGRCGCPSRRRRGRPAGARCRGPSGPGSRTRRSGGPRVWPSTS